MGHRTEISGSGTSGHNLGRKILWMYLAQSLFFSFLPYIPIGSLFADFRMDHSNVVKFKKEVAISYLSVVERPESFIWVLVSPKHQINTWRNELRPQPLLLETRFPASIASKKKCSPVNPDTNGPKTLAILTGDLGSKQFPALRFWLVIITTLYHLIWVQNHLNVLKI